MKLRAILLFGIVAVVFPLRSDASPILWRIGGDSLGGGEGVLGTMDASPVVLVAAGAEVLVSDGTATKIGRTSDGSTLDLRADAAASLAALGPVSIDTRASLSLGASAASISIGNTSGPFAASGTSLSFDCGGVPDCAVDIGDSATSHRVTVGSTAGSSALTLNAGTGQLLLQANGRSWAWPSADGAVDSWALITDGRGNLYFAPPMAGAQSIVQVTCTLVAGAATCPSGYDLDPPTGPAKIVGAPMLQLPNGSTELGRVNAYVNGNAVVLTSYSASAGRATGDVATYLVSLIGAQ